MKSDLLFGILSAAIVAVIFYAAFVFSKPTRILALTIIIVAGLVIPAGESAFWLRLKRKTSGANGDDLT